QPSELRPRVENATAKQSPAWQSLRLAPAGELQAGVLLLLAAIPELLVEEVGDAVAQRLDQGHGAAQGQAAGDEIANAEGDGEVHRGETERLGHNPYLLGSTPK